MKDVLYFNTLEDIKLIDMMRVSKSKKHDYSQDYLTFEALNDGTFTFGFNPRHLNSIIRKLYYSTDDGETWIDIISNLTEVEDDWSYYTSPTIVSGTNILWKGDMDATWVNGDRILSFKSTFNFNASGNPFFVFRGVDWESASTDYEIQGFFSENSSLISAENVYLSYDNTISGKTFTCRNNYGLATMFLQCDNLEIAPKTLPTEVFTSCFSYMFSGCIKLTTVPLNYLPATTLAESCYEGMFERCSILAQAPELPATTLAQSCYSEMFFSCRNLNRIKMMATDISASRCLNFWVSGVSSNGTFVKNSAATWNVTGNNGVPSGWTVETADS